MDFLTHNSGLIVLVVVMVIWIGIFFSLASIDKKISKLEKE